MNNATLTVWAEKKLANGATILVGQCYGRTGHRDGKFVRTSEIKSLDRERGYALSNNTIWKLGDEVTVEHIDAENKRYHRALDKANHFLDAVDAMRKTPELMQECMAEAIEERGHNLLHMVLAVESEKGIEILNAGTGKLDVAVTRAEPVVPNFAEVMREIIRGKLKEDTKAH